ncbi:MAG: ceramidase domain-containing protein [Rhodobacteraceae bacterium]|nr:ceramidase domain-containing protein [Paracoccaceae bacterium]
MDWFREVNNYCERLDNTYWAEPLNAISNASFLIAALIAWRLIGARRDLGARLLTATLAAIGVGSYLFHTHAQVWALILDVAPIQAFILLYVYFATVRFFRVPWWAGALAVALFIPYAALVSRGIAALIGPLNGSVGYAPVPILIAAYALALRTRAPETARGLAIGAAILVVSLFFRTIDAAVCPALPIGTHFLWHLLNGIMLGWMIVVLLRHGEREGAPGLAAARTRG